MFNGKTLLITGGTGSFGHAVLDRFMHTDIGEIRVFSRDEEKQDRMRHELQSNKISYFIGDVRDRHSVSDAMYGVDYVFHAAALKEVPSCEFFPFEAVKTNIIGTENVLVAAIKEGVKNIICLSTDKAAYPINAMGLTKALMEKVYIAKSRTVNANKTTISGTRYGNVMCSRGSVIPLFINQIKSGRPLTITDPNMTRFMMTLKEAVDLVLYSFEHAHTGDTMIMKAPSSTIGDLTMAVKELFADENYPTKVIGIRHGEKMYETLLTREEHLHAEDMGSFFRIVADNRDLNYDKYFVEGIEANDNYEEFNSDNAKRLTVAELKEKLLTIPYIQRELEKIDRL
ncbi:MAG TPA: polysaccharide biosynthesis protein [Clostridiaceae bacterium]|nr:polysaccharide biosynthesis protein [Clostridiaceae bacterium]